MTASLSIALRLQTRKLEMPVPAIMFNEHFTLSEAVPEINYLVWNATLNLCSGHLFARVVANGNCDGLTLKQNETLQTLSSLSFQIAPEVENSAFLLITLFAHGHFDVDLISG